MCAAVSKRPCPTVLTLLVPLVCALQPQLFELTNKWNREPDYNDPDWFEKVTDWDEFWNHTRFDMENAETLEDYYDTSGNPTDTVERAMDMISALNRITGRGDVQNLYTPTVCACTPSLPSRQLHA